jgi:hypothetical protein
MNKKMLAAAVALFAAATPITIFAQSNSPVSIVGSKVWIQSFGSGDMTPGQVIVTFVNNRPSPATDVLFALVSHGSRLADLDTTGTFSKGVAVKKIFATHAPNRDQSVIVSSVKFADGSTWSNPDAPQGTFKAPPYN